MFSSWVQRWWWKKNLFHLQLAKRRPRWCVIACFLKKKFPIQHSLSELTSSKLKALKKQVRLCASLSLCYVINMTTAGQIDPHSMCTIAYSFVFSPYEMISIASLSSRNYWVNTLGNLAYYECILYFHTWEGVSFTKRPSLSVNHHTNCHCVQSMVFHLVWG